MNFERIKKSGPISYEYRGQKTVAQSTGTVSSPTLVYRDQNLFTDVKLKFGDESISAHKVLIGSAIPYFNNMFFSGMKEKDQEEITLKMGPEYGLESTQAIKSIIDFVYTDRITLHVDTVQDVLLTARVLDVAEIVAACADFMSTHISSDNALEVWCLGKQLHCEKLTAEVKRVLLRLGVGTDPFWISEDSLEMDVELLIYLLGSDRLVTESEDHVVTWVKRWLEHEKLASNRTQHVSRILELIRFEYIEVSSLMDMELWQSVSQCLDAIRIVSRAKDRHLSKLIKHHQQQQPTQQARDSYAGIIVCVGGRTQIPGMPPRPLALVEYLSPDSHGKFTFIIKIN
jgi:hypothetical protein